MRARAVGLAVVVLASGCAATAGIGIAPQNRGHPGQLVRDQLEALRGLTPDQARARLRQLGHDGRVSMGVVERYDATCGQDKVCDTSGDGGIGIHDDLVLHTNPKAEIAAPP
jgi:hypothetical protein